MPPNENNAEEKPPWVVAQEREGMLPSDQSQIDELNEYASPQKIRTFLQGISYNTADEAEAAIRSYINGTPYPQEVEEIRAKVENYREQNPGSAMFSEFLGGAVPAAVVYGVSRGRGGAAAPAGVSAEATKEVFSSFFPNLAKVAGYGGLEATAAGIGGSEGDLLSRLDPARMAVEGGIGGGLGAGLFSAGAGAGKFGGFAVDVLRVLARRTDRDSINREVQRIAQEADVSPERAAEMLVNGEALANDPIVAQELRGYRASNPQVSRQVEDALPRVAQAQGEAFEAVQSGLGAGMNRNTLEIARANEQQLNRRVNSFYEPLNVDATPADDNVLSMMTDVIGRAPGQARKLNEAFRSKTGRDLFRFDSETGEIVFDVDPTMMDAEYLRRVVADESGALIERGGADAAIGVNLANAEGDLRTSIDEVMPEIGEARAAASQAFDVKDAYSLGKKVRTPDEVGMAYQDIVESGDPEQLDAFRLGYLVQLKGRMTGQNKTTLTNKILDPEQNEGIAFRTIFPEHAQEDALERLGVAQRTQQSFATIRGGSQTAPTQQAVARQGGANSIAQVVNDLAGSQYGNPSAVANILDRLMRQFRPGITQSQGAEVARVLLSKDPQFVQKALSDKTALRSIQDTIDIVIGAPLMASSQSAARMMVPSED